MSSPLPVWNWGWKQYNGPLHQPLVVQEGIQIGVEDYRLDLISAWKTSHATSTSRRNALIHVELVHKGRIISEGYGEVGLPPRNPAVGYAADWDDVADYAYRVAQNALGGDEDFGRSRFESAIRQLRIQVGTSEKFASAAADRFGCAGIEAALVDAFSRAENVSASAYLASQLAAPRTEMAGYLTVGIASPEEMASSVLKSWQQTRFIKLKMDSNLEMGFACLKAIESRLQQEKVPMERLEIALDANASWSAETAENFLSCLLDGSRLPLLSPSVRIFEQPFPVDVHGSCSKDELERWKRWKDAVGASGREVIADESFSTGADFQKLTQLVHGVNIKLEKCGGPTVAIALTQLAREQGLTVWIGTMVGSRLLCAGAALALQYAGRGDVDGALLVTENSQKFSGGLLWNSLQDLPGKHGIIEYPKGCLGFGCERKLESY